jgi:DNA adenine methylase
MTLYPVKVTKPAAPWIGGKFHLAKKIIPILDAIPHTAYAEPFIGMGGIFLRRSLRPKAEFINDRSKDVYNLFRILQRHYPQFMDTLKWQLTSRADFQRLLDVNPETLTDLERAARFIYLQKTRFGGDPTSRTFGISKHGPARFDLTKLAAILEDIHERLSRVTIECLDYKDFINKYDTDTTLFYIDPPYYKCEDYYGDGLFSRDEFAMMRDILLKLKGSFLLSINNDPFILDLFQDFHIKEVETLYTLDQSRKVTELLISGKPL